MTRPTVFLLRDWLGEKVSNILLTSDKFQCNFTPSTTLTYKVMLHINVLGPLSDLRILKAV
jgi:hypothetical protein